MSIDTFTKCELWNLRKPLISSRSRLHHLEPVGIGTPYVESLAGYIARLAKSHCLLPGALISQELAQLVPKVYKTRNLYGIRDWTGALNSTGTMALDLVMVLETLTLRRDLRFLTLLTWTDTLPKRNLIRTVRAWCPACYEEWHSAKQVIYEPLLWSIQAVTACLRHQRRLSFQCPHCNQPLPQLSPYSRPGYCSKCFEWLGSSYNSQSFDNLALAKEELMWQTWVVNTVGELLAIAPRLQQPMPSERVAQAFRTYVKQMTEGNIAAFARMLQIPKNKVWMWETGKVLPQLNILLIVCYCLRTSVLDFLSLNIARENISQLTQPPPSSQTYKAIKQLNNTEFDPARVQQVLEAVLQGVEKPPPPMTEVARRVGHNRRVIYRHFPNLCQAISAQYVKYKFEARENRIRQCCEEVRHAVQKLYDEGVHPTEARVSALLAQPGCFRDKEVRAALQEVIGRWGK